MAPGKTRRKHLATYMPEQRLALFRELCNRWGCSASEGVNRLVERAIVDQQIRDLTQPKS